MNKLKHTPGPWKELFNGNYWDIKCLGDDDGDINTYNPNIAYCMDNKNYEHTAHHSEFNARLIAAAPDMLEALIKIYNNGNINGFEYVIIEEVIERATGLKIEEVLNEN